PRGPRFGASITAVILLVIVGLAVATPPGQTALARATEPAFILFAVVAALFAWGAFRGVARHPYSLMFRYLVRPRLAAPLELEDSAAPTFAQGIGLVIATTGLALHLIGTPYALGAAASAAFVAAFLNAVFAYCLGCQIYLLLARAGLVGRRNTSSI
ncbi:MAG: DUF4395 domain-containing protein, partial [Rhodoglobus sp.]|nr:DUF4395 domain-containing protein [Rhodoglobus sp.]